MKGGYGQSTPFTRLGSRLLHEHSAPKGRKGCSHGWSDGTWGVGASTTGSACRSTGIAPPVATTRGPAGADAAPNLSVSAEHNLDGKSLWT